MEFRAGLPIVARRAWEPLRRILGGMVCLLILFLLMLGASESFWLITPPIRTSWAVVWASRITAAGLMLLIVYGGVLHVIQTGRDNQDPPSKADTLPHVNTNGETR